MRLTNPFSLDLGRGVSSLTNVTGPGGVFGPGTFRLASEGIVGFAAGRLVSLLGAWIVNLIPPLAGAIQGRAWGYRVVMGALKMFLGSATVNAMFTGEDRVAVLTGLYTEILQSAVLTPVAEGMPDDSLMRHLGMASDDSGGLFPAINRSTRRVGQARAGSWESRARSPYNARGLGSQFYDQVGGSYPTRRLRGAKFDPNYGALGQQGSFSQMLAGSGSF